MSCLYGVVGRQLGDVLVITERSTGNTLGRIEVSEMNDGHWTLALESDVIKGTDEVRLSMYTRGTCNPNGGWGYVGTVEWRKTVADPM